uniref:Uncharacterized protein n=1 Tax=Chromera velia CCMP2878 TaxID=1169474 RepID=A0A0G4FCZ3_9ALVE|eukprot:Cvel_3190.t1-p1 / transcript=Cvel_3190.t1 / gene=Cvel_3190 / organism=Chromera_velia_CCMP2878 / gene_product=hypothetical protein / transcript_product=hypothetical protein / location=Cvel_scaffold124:82240-82581(+) / protein_length=114 / sequence_SO=supercontig / SO=protein_coding / is_pseudo=false
MEVVRFSQTLLTEKAYEIELHAHRQGLINAQSQPQQQQAQPQEYGEANAEGNEQPSQYENASEDLFGDLESIQEDQEMCEENAPMEDSEGAQMWKMKEEEDSDDESSAESFTSI